MMVALLSRVNVRHLHLLLLVSCHLGERRLWWFSVFGNSEIIGSESSLVSGCLEFILNHLFEILTELILSFKDNVLLGWVHIHVYLFSWNCHWQINELWVASLGLIQLIGRVNWSFYLLRLHKSVVNEQQHVRLLGLHCIGFTKYSMDAISEVLQVFSEINEVFTCCTLPISFPYNINSCLILLLVCLFLSSNNVVSRDIRLFIIHFPAAEFDLRVMNCISGDYFNDFCVFLVQPYTFLSLGMIVEHVPHLNSGPLLPCDWFGSIVI